MRRCWGTTISLDTRSGFSQCTNTKAAVQQFSHLLVIVCADLAIPATACALAPLCRLAMPLADLLVQHLASCFVLGRDLFAARWVVSVRERV